MVLKILKAILGWGTLLFIFNYILLFVLMLLLGEKAGSLAWLPFSLVSTWYATYRGVIAYSQVSSKEKTAIINNVFMAIIVGFCIAAISAFFFGLAALIFSGQFDFQAPGILVGAVGGLVARQKIQGKQVKIFGIKF